jgi:hypothetical protein
VKLSIYGKPIFSSAKPRSSGEVVIKNREKADIRTRNRKVIVSENTNVDPVIKFITNIKDAKTAPALIELNQR